MKAKKHAGFSSETLTQRPWLWCEVERRALAQEQQNDSLTMSLLPDGSSFARSWLRLYEMALSVMVKLRDLGVKAYDYVGIDARMRCETVAAILAVQALGAVCVLFPESLPKSRKLKEISELKLDLMMVEGLEKLSFYFEALGDAALPMTFLVMDPHFDEELSLKPLPAWASLQKIHCYEEIYHLREQFRKSFVARVCDDYPLAYVYSHGSTVHERRILLTHGMLRIQAEELSSGIALEENDKLLNDANEANAVALAVFAACVHASAQCIWFERNENILDTVAELQADVLFLIPARILALKKALLEGNGALQEQWLRFCAKAAKFSKRNTHSWLNWSKPIISNLFVQRFRNALGNKLKKLVSYGHFFESRAAEFFSFLEIKTYNAYSFSDVGGFAHVHEFQGDGSYFRSLDAKVNDGILALRYKKIAGNWQSTNDHVFEDERCGLCVRRHFNVKLISGEQIDVTALEDALRREVAIEEIFIFGEQKSFLSALIYLREEFLQQWAKHQGIVDYNFQELSLNPSVYEHINEIVERHNYSRASFEAIQKIALLPTPLKSDPRILTSTKLTRRYEVETRYQAILRSFYEDAF
ncbi:MAG: AMP-binding protein [Bradymonadia bacterium]